MYYVVLGGDQIPTPGTLIQIHSHKQHVSTQTRTFKLQLYGLEVVCDIIPKGIPSLLVSRQMVVSDVLILGIQVVSR